MTENPFEKMESQLKHLANMRKRRGHSDFKNRLRGQLLEQADALNERKEKRSWAMNFDWLIQRKWVPATAAALIVILVAVTILPGGFGNIPSLVNIAEADDYYTLTPIAADASGVASTSGFVLESKGELNIKDVEDAFHVEPAIELTLDQTDDQTIEITPAEALDPGTIYKFELAAQDLDDSPFKKEYRWAYEVSETFGVSGTLPGDQSTYVPTNTGIEVTFNTAGINVAEFEKHFSIEPAATGSFDVREKVGIFIPSADAGLTEGTIYTVTISAGMPLDDTDKTLSEDYTFQFETDPVEERNTSLSFQKDTFEFTPGEKPTLPVNYYERNGEEAENPEMHVSVYRYATGDDYAAARETKNRTVPSWAHYNEDHYRHSTTDLSHVQDYPNLVITTDNYQELATFPEALSEGYYLVEITKNDAIDQAFIQVSNTAAYITLSETTSLIWVNDIDSGKPVKNATVEILNSTLSTQTNDEGIATFENLYETLSLETFEEQSVFFKITANNQDTYYEIPLYLGTESSNNLYWNLFETDRDVYQPNDKLYYWGFVQGRETAIENKATLVVTSSYFSTGKDLERIEEENALLVKETIEIQDGGAFEGSLDIDTFSPGYYTLALIQGDHVLSQNSFEVQQYVKPAYQIVVDTEDEMLFDGESTTVEIDAQFFEGTPVSNLDLRYNEDVVTTDETGNVQVTYKGDVENGECEEEKYCSFTSYQSVYVTPLNEELADISGGVEFRIFRTHTGMAIGSVDREAIVLDTYKVDLDKIDREVGRWKTDADINGGPAPQTKIELEVERVDWVEEKTGETYDDITKEVTETFETRRVEVSILDTTLTTDAEGRLNHPLNLEEGYEYNIHLRIFDDEGNFYDENRYLSSYTYGQTHGITLSPDSETLYDIGENIHLSATSNNSEQPLSEDGSETYLFMEARNGLKDHTVTTTPALDITFTKEMVPNVIMTVIMFDGTHYRLGSNNAILEFDREQERLDVELSMDKTEYEPGEEVTLTVKTSSAESGSPTQAYVNLNLVDEAYYSLFSQNFSDPLYALYSAIDSDIGATYTSHYYPEYSDEGGKGGCFVAGTQILMGDGSSQAIETVEAGDTILTRISPFSTDLVEGTVTRTMKTEVGEYLLVNDTLGVTEEHVLFFNGQWQLAADLEVGDTLVNRDGENVPVESIRTVHREGMVYNFEVENFHTYFADGIYVHNDKGGARQDFRDTALFTVVETDANGTASVTFELPDNITSWRVTGAAVKGDELMAGYGNAQVVVSKDVFVLPVINTQYLTGDEPGIPVRAYGDALTTGTVVTFTMESETLDYSAQESGEAFKVTTFQLPALTKGTYKITTSATSGDNTDTVILPISVEDSHMLRAQTAEALLTENTRLEGSETQRTDVTFLNHEVGSLYNVLQAGASENGDRVDQVVLKQLSRQWLNERFGDTWALDEFPSTLYQESNEYTGEGVRLLPYADTDLKWTAQVAGVDPSLWDQRLLKITFENALNSPDRTLSEKILALYGLASVGENVLTELNYFVGHFDLSLENKLYAALTYTTYGADGPASDIFLDVFNAYAKTDGDNIVITNEGATLDQELSWTALMATLAEQLGSDQRDALWQTVVEKDNYWDTENRTELVHLEKLLFIKNRLARDAQTTVSFEWNSEKITLENNEMHTLSVLPEDLANATFSNIDGEVSVITHYEEPIDLETLEVDTTLTITRTYRVNDAIVSLEDASAISAGDILQIEFNVTAPNNSSYRVTEYLPSGLQTLSHTNYNDEGDSQYRHPYHVDQQELDFYVYCSDKMPCNGRTFYYLARVVNTGSFVMEPASIQSYTDTDRINISGKRGRLEIAEGSD